MLLHFEREFGWITVDFVLDLERVINSRQGAVSRKLNVHHGTDNLNNFSFIHKS